MKRLRNVERLPFTFLPLFKEQGEEIDCRSETINEVVAARVVITCLNRHILCFQKSSFFFFNVSRDNKRQDESRCIGYRNGWCRLIV